VPPEGPQTGQLPGSATRISANLRDGGDEFVSSAVDLAVVLKGGTGGDTVSSGASGDRLEGESGDDDLSAGPGNDRLNDGPGVDSLNGEEGNDRLDGVDGGPESEFDCGRGIDRASLDLVDLDAASRIDIAVKLATGRSFLKLVPPTDVLGCENDGVASGDQQPTPRVGADDARLERRSLSVPLLCPASRGCKGRFELGRKGKALGARSYDLGGGEQRRLPFGLSRSTARSLSGKRLPGVALERDPRGRPKATFASFKPHEG
jgi:Ca2+-binding RTX toxin-like protein